MKVKLCKLILLIKLPRVNCFIYVLLSRSITDNNKPSNRPVAFSSPIHNSSRRILFMSFLNDSVI